MRVCSLTSPGTKGVNGLDGLDCDSSEVRSIAEVADERASYYWNLYNYAVHLGLVAMIVIGTLKWLLMQYLSPTPARDSLEAIQSERDLKATEKAAVRAFSLPHQCVKT